MSVQYVISSGSKKGDFKDFNPGSINVPDQPEAAATFVYFITKGAGLVKIGVSCRPDKRLASLRTGAAGTTLELIGAIPGTFADERDWHACFAKKRVVLEWFTFDDELKAAVTRACGSNPVPSYSPIKSIPRPVGRPAVADPNSERSRKPWVAKGISQRTYYRRKAQAAAVAPRSPQQHAAHVADWFATLGSIERLEHRAFVRRCISAAFRA